VLTAASDYPSPDGTVRLRRGAHLVNARVERESVVASAVLYANDVMEGENKDADEMASPVRIPCSLLTLGAVEVADEDRDAPETTRQWLVEPKRSEVAFTCARNQPTGHRLSKYQHPTVTIA